MWIIALVGAYVIVRAVEDASYGARGKTPPRHEWRMALLDERAQSRQAKASAKGTRSGRARKGGGRSAAGRYFAGLWADSWQSAHVKHQALAGDRERRAKRRAAHVAAKRQARDARADHRREQRAQRRAQPATATGQQEREETTTDQTTSTEPMTETETGSEPAGSEEGVEPIDLDETDEPTSTSETEQTTDEAEHEQHETEMGAAATAVATSTETSSINSEGVSPVSTPTGEITGLESAQQFCNELSQYLDMAVTATEQSVANLEAGGVSGEALTALTEAQEQLSQAQQAYETAQARFTAHMAVRESYQANPDAGSREFVTAE